MARFTTPQQVAHERVEDEVIAINLTTGTYFSLRDSAADVWSLLLCGADVENVSAALAAADGLDASTIVEDIRVYIAALVEAGLLIDDDGALDVAASLPTIIRAYAAPTVERYDDMEELLLLDPIHEVDDAGWPVVSAEPR